MNAQAILRFVRLPQLEVRYSNYCQEAFRKHTHDTYSIGIVLQGHSTFFHSGRTDSITAGDVVLIEPGEVHACNPRSGSAMVYYMLYIDVPFMQRIAPSDGGAVRFRESVVRDAALYASLVRWCGAVFAANGQMALAIETRLVDILSTIRYGTADAEKPSAQTSLHKSHAYMMDNLARAVSLDELSALSGLSPYHFLRVFRRSMGLPPHTYQLQQRISLARRLLAEGQPIAQVAVEVGFADQSHFTRKFKACVGATPGQYQSAFVRLSAAAANSRSGV